MTDNFEFIEPIALSTIKANFIKDEFCLGSKVVFWDGAEIEFNNYDIAIIGLKDNSEQQFTALHGIRRQLYNLYPGNWQKRVVDLGDVPLATSYNDSEFLIKSILQYLLRKNVVPIILGTNQKYTLTQYRAYDEVKYMVNLTNIDSSFDLGDADKSLEATNFVGHMIVNKPYNLFNYANLGYQSYYVRQDEIDLIEKLFFEAYRLGEVTKDLKMVEPILRDTDLLSIDLMSLRNSEIPLKTDKMINGYLTKELCTIARYAGLSEKITSLGLYHTGELPISLTYFESVAQIIWYFLEGFNLRRKEQVNIKNPNFTKYIVPAEESDLVFYRSDYSERWWMEIPQFVGSNNKLKELALLPCTEANYLNACQKEIPERWLKAKLKNEI